MSSIKCPNCGLVNFASATACKRCKQELEAPSYPYWNENGAVKPPEPDSSKLQTVPDVPGEFVDLEDFGDGSHTVGNKLFGIYLVMHMIRMLVALHNVTAESSGEVWKSLTNPKSTHYLASFELMYYVVLLGVIVLLPSALLLLITLLRKAKAFLTLVVLYLFAEFGISVLCIWLMFRHLAELREKHMPQFDVVADQAQWLPYTSIIGLLLTFIWFRYFTTSKRARLVFG
jgi:hypothetical protein